MSASRLGLHGDFKSACLQLKRLSAEQLRHELDARNLPTFPYLARAELEERVKEWLRWSSVSCALLRKEVLDKAARTTSSAVRAAIPERRHAEPSQEEEQEQQMQLLVLMAVLAWCLPDEHRSHLKLSKLEDPREMLGLVKEWEGYLAMSSDALLAAHASFGFPDGSTLSRQNMEDRLRQVVQWTYWPVRELQAECKSRALLGEGGEDFSVASDKETLLQRLLLEVCPRLYLEHIPVAKASVQAPAVAHMISCLHKMPNDELQRQAKEWNFLTAEIDRQTRKTWLSKLCAVPVMQYLSVSELEEECREWGIPLASYVLPERRKAEERRNELNDLMFFALNDVPLEHFTSVSDARAMAEQFMGIASMNMQDLEKLCEDWQMPKRRKDRAEYIKQIQYATLWWDLPMEKLLTECEKHGISLADLPKKEGNEMREQALDAMLYWLVWAEFEEMGIMVGDVATLSAAWRLYEDRHDIKAASVDELTDWYRDTGLDPRGLHAGEMRARLHEVAAWWHMPMPSLQRLCQANRVGIHGERENIIANLARVKFSSYRMSAGGQHLPRPFERVHVSKPSGVHQRGPPGAYPKAMPRYTQRPPPPAPKAKAPPSRPSAAPPPQQPKSNKPRLAQQQVKEFYSLLELPQGSDLSKIKQAYRRLALKTHPDKSNSQDIPAGGAEFVKISNAYQALVDHVTALENAS